MSPGTAFFAAPDDGSAVAFPAGPDRFATLTGEYFSALGAVDEWDRYFAGPLPDPPGRGLAFLRRRSASARPSEPRWIKPWTHDGSGMFALPPRLTRSLADARVEELERLAARWAERLRREDGDEMTDDDLPALVRAVARLATSAATTRGNLYCWFH
ncbi:hypothetical protein J2S46_007554 [Kitasatospora herbaricolor]|uniref:hypothetical protein n=1 Tax=Kitasatospora herbaricolor TaxID=68217 RepID=UPI00174E4D44|nr:hypothetical protein [Kitasatospora herbaricolor]MDQ0312998.1 hypothetical protein [Kitasatospora herbaricolor]